MQHHLAFKPGDKTLSRLTQLIIVVEQLKSLLKTKPFYLIECVCHKRPLCD